MPAFEGLFDDKGNASEDQFDEILNNSLGHEGGFTVDHAGPTNRGITQDTFNRYRKSMGLDPKDVKEIRDDETYDLYRSDFYETPKIDKLPKKVAGVVFDFGINSSPDRAIKTLQRTVGATPDGDIGPKTISAVNSFIEQNGEDALVNGVLDKRQGFLNKLIQDKPEKYKKFENGWMDRIKKLRDQYGKPLSNLDPFGSPSYADEIPQESGWDNLFAEAPETKAPAPVQKADEWDKMFEEKKSPGLGEAIQGAVSSVKEGLKTGSDKAKEMWQGFSDSMGGTVQSTVNNIHVAIDKLDSLNDESMRKDISTWKQNNPEMWGKLYGNKTEEELFQQGKKEADTVKAVLSGGAQEMSFGALTNEQLEKEFPLAYGAGRLAGGVGSFMTVGAGLKAIGLGVKAVEAGQAARAVSELGPRFVPRIIMTGSTFGAHTGITEAVSQIKEGRLDVVKAGTKIATDTALGGVLGVAGGLVSVPGAVVVASGLGYTSAKLDGSKEPEAALNGAMWGLFELVGGLGGREVGLKGEAIFKQGKRVLADYAQAKDPAMSRADAEASAEGYLIKSANEAGGVEKVLSSQENSLSYLEKVNQNLYNLVKKMKAEAKPTAETGKISVSEPVKPFEEVVSPTPKDLQKKDNLARYEQGNPISVNVTPEMQGAVESGLPPVEIKPKEPENVSQNIERVESGKPQGEGPVKTGLEQGSSGKKIEGYRNVQSNEKAPEVTPVEQSAKEAVSKGMNKEEWIKGNVVEGTAEDFEINKEKVKTVVGPAFLVDGKIIGFKYGENGIMNHSDIAEKNNFFSGKKAIPGFLDKNGNFKYQYLEDADSDLSSIYDKAKGQTETAKEAIKEPWQMSKEEYIKYSQEKKLIEKGTLSKSETAAIAKDLHWNIVNSALENGKTIPESVLAEYPDLKKAEPKNLLETYSDNIKSFLGKLNDIGKNRPSREEIFKKYDNTLKPLSEIPKKVADIIGASENKVYSSEAYLIDHHIHNHAGTTKEEYTTIYDVLNNPDYTKVDDRGAEGKSYIFVKKFDRYHAAVVKLNEKDGKILLHKTFFTQNRKPYKNLPDLVGSKDVGEVANPPSAKPQDEASAVSEISALPTKKNIPSKIEVVKPKEKEPENEIQPSEQAVKKSIKKTFAKDQIESFAKDNHDILLKQYEEQNGNIISVDRMKLLFKPVGYTGIDSTLYQEPAGKLILEYFNKKLSEIKGQGKDVVLMTGGTGSGKSTFIRGYENSDNIIFDLNLRNIEKNTALVQSIIDSGNVPFIKYVLRNPAEAFVNGVLKRAIDKESPDYGRAFPIDVHVLVHKQAMDVFKALNNKFGDSLKYEIIDNRGDLGTSKKIGLEEFQKIEYPYSEIAKELKDYVRENKEVSKDLSKEFLRVEGRLGADEPVSKEVRNQQSEAGSRREGDKQEARDQVTSAEQVTPKEPSKDSGSESAVSKIETEIGKTSVDDIEFANLGVSPPQQVKKPVNDKVDGVITFSDPEVEARFKAAHGVTKESLINKLKSFLNDIKNRATRVYPELPNSPKYAEVRNILSKQQSNRTVANDRAIRAIDAITAGFGPKKMDLFTRKVILDDLMREAEAGHPVPFGYSKYNEDGSITTNTEMLVNDKKMIDTIVNQNPDVLEAFNKRKMLWEAIQNDLVNYGILSQEQIKQDYFRHQVLDYAKLKATQGVGKKLRTPTPGYAKRRSGSVLDINTDYVQAEFEVMAQALHDIDTAKNIKTIEDSDLNIVGKLREEAKKLSEGKDEKIDWHSLIPEGYTTWQPKEGNIFFMANSISDKAVQIALEGFKGTGLDPQMLKKVLAVGTKRKEFVLPIELATTLDNLYKVKQPNALMDFGRNLTTYWKRWVLMNPRRFIKYNYQNFVGDFDAIIAGDVKILKHFGKAYTELYGVMLQGKPMTQDMKEFFERGGLSAQMTVNELPELKNLEIFRRMLDTSATKDFAHQANLWRRYWNGIGTFTTFRESIFRYAAYLHYKSVFTGGGKTTYGASMKDEIDGLKDPLDKAAKVATELLGDYGNLTAFGKDMREAVVPFYSWLEINAKRYSRLFRNSFSEGWEKGIKTSATIAGVKGSFFLAKWLVRAMALSALMVIYNRAFFPDEEDDLSEYDKNRLHIVLGRDKDGRPIILRGQTAFGDIIEWFGLDAAPSYWKEYTEGKASFADLFGQIPGTNISAFGLNPAQGKIGLHPAAMKMMRGINPLYKLPVETATGKSMPVFDDKSWKVEDKMRNILRAFSLENEYDLVTKKPSRGYLKSWNEAVFTTNDPGETAYRYIQGEKYKFLETVKGKGGSGDYYSPRSLLYREYKKALRFKDESAIKDIKNKMDAIGITEKDLNKSLEKSDPLSGLTKEDKAEFTDLYLTERDRQIMLPRANKYFHDTFLPEKKPWRM